MEIPVNGNRAEGSGGSPGNSDAAPKKILLVDDNLEFLEIVAKILEKEGYVVLKAANGAEAVKLFKLKRSDLVITDLVMPEKGGLELLQELKSLSPYLKVIAISGGPDGNTAWLPIAKRLGALRVLKKPIAREKLLQVVEEVLSADS